MRKKPWAKRGAKYNRHPSAGPIAADARIGSRGMAGYAKLSACGSPYAAIAFYLLAAGMLVRAVGPGPDRRQPRMALAVRWPACCCMALYHLLVAWRTPGGPDMHFFSALSLVGLGMAAMTTAVGAQGRMAALGVLVLPAGGGAAAGLSLCTGMSRRRGLDWRLQLHAWLALLAYATLAIAALLAMMLWAQERALRRREFHAWLRALPPLTELEDLLFRTHHRGLRAADRDAADRRAVRREPVRPAPGPQDRAQRAVLAGLRRPAGGSLALRLARRQGGALDPGWRWPCWCWPSSAASSCWNWC